MRAPSSASVIATGRVSGGPGSSGDAYRAGDPVWNDVACGAALLMLSLVQIAAPRRSAPLGWLCALIGLWLIASALWVNATSAAVTNDVVVGFAVAVFAVAGLAGADSALPERSLADRADGADALSQRWRPANLRGARHAPALGRVHGGVPGSLVGEV